MSIISDVYEKLDDRSEEAKKTDYALQTLWCDMTSECDIIGPYYYTSSGLFKAKGILAFVMDALQKFHCHGFDVCCFICDGPTANLTMIKILLGKKGNFECDPTSADQHHVKAYFTNPFNDPFHNLSISSGMHRIGPLLIMNEFHIHKDKLGSY